MAGAIGDIAEPEQVAFVDVGIVLGLALDIGEVARPAHEMRDRAHRPVAIEHLEAKPARREIALHGGERRRGCAATSRQRGAS